MHTRRWDRTRYIGWCRSRVAFFSWRHMRLSGSFEYLGYGYVCIVYVLPYVMDGDWSLIFFIKVNIPSAVFRKYISFVATGKDREEVDYVNIS